MGLDSSDSGALFNPGRLLATPGVMEATKKAGQGIEPLLRRHLAGDWGDVCDEDRETNNEALELGNRLVSSYNLSNGVKVWIITECDRSATTFLLPSEY